MKVTFDTNMWIRLVNENMRLTHTSAADIERIKNCIAAGKIEPYFCDATAFESIDKKYRQTYLEAYAAPKMEIETMEPTGEEIDGLALMKSTYVMANRPDRSMNDLWKKDITDALNARFVLMKSLVPKFSSMITALYPNKEVYEPISDLILLKNRFAAAKKLLDQNGVGAAYAKNLAASVLNIPIDEFRLVDLAFLQENKVAPAVSEWIDGVIICSHYAYNHDYLCTLDSGTGLKGKSVFHPSHRAWLHTLGVEIIGPKDLADKLGC